MSDSCTMGIYTSVKVGTLMKTPNSQAGIPQVLVHEQEKNTEKEYHRFFKEPQNLLMNFSLLSKCLCGKQHEEHSRVQ